MSGDFEQSDARSQWVLPALVVGMATLFVVLLVTTVLVWLLSEDRVEHEVPEGWTLAEDASETVLEGDRSLVSPSETETDPIAVVGGAVAPSVEPKIVPTHAVDAPPAVLPESVSTREADPAADADQVQPGEQKPGAGESESPPGDRMAAWTETRVVVERVVVPDPQARARALEQLTSTRGGQIRSATAAEDKRSVAEALVEQAGREQDAAQRYVLLEQARALAMDAGDLPLSLSVVGAMERGFEIDTTALTAEVLNKLAKSVTSQEEHRTVARSAVACARNAANTGNAELAEDLYVMALGAAREVSDAQLEGTIQRGLAQLAPAQAVPALAPATVDLANVVTSQEVAQANQTLQLNPQDADAHLTVGKFLCFVKEDWRTGLAHLARGSDTSLSKLARDDMHLPRTSKNLVDLADAWYNWGLQTDASTRKSAWSRALGDYIAASPQLIGTKKDRIDRRVAELTEAIEEQERIRALSQSWLAAPPGLVRSFEGHNENVTALAVSADGALLASAAEDRTVRLWNIDNGQEVWKQRTKTSHLNGIVITPDPKFVICNYDDKRFAVMNATNGRLMRHVGDSPMSPTAVRLSPDGLSLVWAARSRPPNVFVWSLAKDQAMGAYGDGDCANVLAISRDGQRIATGDSSGAVRVLDTATGKVIHQLRAHTDAVTDLDFSPGGELVATAALNELCVFDLTSYEPVQTFRVESVRTVAFSPDGRRLASGGFREEVFLWDLQTGQQYDTLKAETAFSDRHITRIAFLPDPHGLITGATGGKIRLWRLPD